MANRHLSRSLAMQTLFEWDFNGCHDDKIKDILEQNASEFAPGLEDISFVQALVDGVLGKRKKLDNIIEKAAPDWPIEQIAIVDRNILRLGLYELLFGDKSDVPARVAINESIELAKTFGGENSGRFINGVLGAIYKEMGEPGKDDVPEKKKRVKDLPFEQMPIEKLSGAVVYGEDKKGEISLALVFDVFGYWTLSKGHIDEGEEVKAGAKREIKEELSLDIDIMAELGSNEYVASDPEKGKIRKQVTYFLAKAKDMSTLFLPEKGGLKEARWFPLAEVAELRIYNDIVPIITEAVKIILK
jgi:N utilization substance protein B